MNDKSLRETAERIIEGVPISYRDGDEEAGRERTVNWLMDLLERIVCGSGDWTEDAVDTDNGRYLNHCSLCGQPFVGHKRRVVCKMCSRSERGEADTKRLIAAARAYMSQFGQALEAHDIPFGSAQKEADEKLRDAIAAMKEGK